MVIVRRVGPTGKLRSSPGSGSANLLESFADARFDIPVYRRHVDDRRLAGQVGTNGDRSNTVSSGPLTW